MYLFILRSNIDSPSKVKALKPVLRKLKFISRWTVDTEDIDHVLRIESTVNRSESEVAGLLRSFGILCEPLPDEIQA